MTLVFATGFESGSNYELNGGISTGYAYVDSGYKRTGSYGFKASQSGYGALRFTPLTDLYLQVCIRPLVADTGTYFELTDERLVPLITVRKTSTHLLEIRLGSATGTILGVSNAAVAFNTWNIIQIHLRYGEYGLVEAKLENDLFCNYGGDTRISGASGAAGVKLFSISGGTCDCYDDIIVNDTTGDVNNSWPNGASVHRLVPNGSGQYTQWTPSSGQNWDCLDETPMSSSDYVYSLNPGDKDAYEFTNTSLTGVGGVILRYFGYQIGNPPVKKVKPLIRLDGTDYIGEALTLPFTSFPIWKCYDKAPDGSAWDQTKVNALQAGMVAE